LGKKKKEKPAGREKQNQTPSLAHGLDPPLHPTLRGWKYSSSLNAAETGDDKCLLWSMYLSATRQFDLRYAT